MRLYQVSLQVLGIACLLVFPGISTAAPTDFDGDGTSDLSSVEIVDDNLRWVFQESEGITSTIDKSFGKPGVHLVPGRYSSSPKSQIGRVNDSGTWFVQFDNGVRKEEFGAEGATYMGGADVDGDGLDDLLFHTNRCTTKDVTVIARTNAFSGNPQDVSITASKGVWKSFYADANGDGADDFCWLQNNGTPRKPKKRFTLKCKDLLSGSEVVSSNVGTVFQTPLPIAQSGGRPDLLAFPRNRKKKTEFLIKDINGRTVVKNVRFGGVGTLLTGNFTNQSGATEQIGLHRNGSFELFDPESKSRTILAAPEGIPFDELNINSFDDTLQNCQCDTQKVKKTKRCKGLGKGGCVSRDITDGGGNWLHKPESDNTGNIVNLFNPADRPQNCRYERLDGTLFREAFYTGDSNPNRPTWRPRGGGTCRDFPKPLIVSCVVKGRKNCWRIPDPCQRYD